MDVKKLVTLTAMSVLFAACSPSGSNSDQFNKAASACEFASVKNEKIVRWKNGTISRIVLKDKEDTLRRFVDKNFAQIESIENNFKISKPVIIPQLETFARNASPVANWGFDKVRAQVLHDKNVLGQGVIVAVVDSGVDAKHPQIKNQLYTVPGEIAGNGVDDDGNGLVDDVNGYDFTSSSSKLSDSTGHGTHVSGIILADPNNGPIKGMAPKAKLLVYDFFDSNGDGTVFDAIKALRATARVGTKVVNASWGGPSCSSALQVVLQELADQDILFVTAAGNGDEFGVGQNNDLIPSYPASYTTDTLISVGAMTVNNVTAGFSNFGQSVHLVAPGVGIYSTYPPQTYASDDGTSMASPFVAGAAVLLRSAFPEATAIQVKEALLASTKSGPYPVLTRGVLDVAAAYDYLEAQLAQSLP